MSVQGKYIYNHNEGFYELIDFDFSTPAPGYFNDDDVLDIILHVNGGAWPDYSISTVRANPKIFIFNVI